MMGYLMDGGWMMLPLLVCSVVLVAVIIDRARAFRAASKSDAAKLRKVVRESVADGDVAAAVSACETEEGPVAAVLLTGKGNISISAGEAKVLREYCEREGGCSSSIMGAAILTGPSRICSARSSPESPLSTCRTTIRSTSDPMSFRMGHHRSGITPVIGRWAFARMAAGSSTISRRHQRCLARRSFRRVCRGCRPGLQVGHQCDVLCL